MYRIALEGDFLVLHHPERGEIDIAKLIPNPLVKTPEWECLIHEMAAGPRLARAAMIVLEGVAAGAISWSTEGGEEALDILREVLAGADPEHGEAPTRDEARS